MFRSKKVGAQRGQAGEAGRCRHRVGTDRPPGAPPREPIACISGPWTLDVVHAVILNDGDDLYTPPCSHAPQVTGQYILKPGDEVVFVLHTNLKNGELNAQRVRRTKEGPELSPPGGPGTGTGAPRGSTRHHCHI